MTRRILNVVLVLACLLGFQSANAEFKDIKVDLTNGNLLTDDEIANTSITKFGVAVGADGSVSRVAADDASAAIVLSGKFHSKEHGWGNFSSTVKVEGSVKISMGTCAWGGDVTVKNEAGETVATFNTNDGTCFHNTRGENGIGNVAYGFYRGEATTLTISGGSYTPYIAVENATNMPQETEISFGFGKEPECGVLPEGGKVEVGKTFTIPVNCTLYQEGKTLTGWSDGSKTYQIGEIINVADETPIALTPVFVDNTVSLADRKDAVTVKWDFLKRNGAPNVGFQRNKGFWVGQTQIGTEVIDVVLNFDTTNGKLNNTGWNDWAQINGGTILYVPSCKGATISLESFSATTTTTIDGEKIGDGTTQPSFTVAGDAEIAELVIGDGAYFRWVQVELPYVPKDLAGTTYNNENASVVWAFNSANYMEDITVAPENTFAITNFDLGVCTVTGTASTTECKDVTFVCIRSSNGASDVLKWTVKPVKGLTFTPTSVSFYVARNGTDGNEKCVTVSGETEGASEIFAEITPHRNNKTQNDDKFGSADSYTKKFEYTLTEAQQKALTSGEGFSIVMNNGYATNKAVMVSDVHINGVLNGTVAAVDKYSLTLSSNLEGAGTVTAYPSADKYEVGTEVKLAAARNFGYKFINWTDAAGNEVSKEATFIYTVTANAEICANFEAVNTYALSYKVTGGANLYMVSLEPAPTVIDNKNMYEEGTTVTATASSNPILSFTNWNDGQTSSEISVVMDADKSIVANYSAIDYIAGWDFIRSGNDGRPADFASADNDAASLVFRKADGTTSSWLDKSQASGGYEGRPGGVSWRDNCLGDYYWQTMVNAEAFTDIKLITAMCYNYNAYQVYNIEYSIDGENWTKVGAIEMPGVKNWTDGEFNLPAAANNQPKLYIRWIADKNSNIDGTSSEKDGICIGASYIVGTAKLIDDGTAPKLVSAVPEEGATTASINGKIVLTFDEKVKAKEGVKATLGNLEIEPEVVGKTVIFKYKNLTYGTKYTFNLPAGSISDLTDNAIAEAIKINFSTKTRPAVAKALYDAEVSTVDELVAAIKAAQTREDMTKRFRIFIHDGFYRLPASETATKDGIDGNKYPDPTTYINSPKISFIGESMEGVVITNTVPETEGNNGFNTANVLEGIGRGDVLRLDGKATETYFQNLTMKSSMGDARGRDIVLNDNSNKTIFKDACLWAYQDTYVSNNNKSRFYFEGGLLRGRTDFLCGKGDVFYNGVTLQMCATGGHLAVPSVPTKYGYIFKDCEIVGETNDVDGNFSLGRPWGSGTPIALYIDTKMTARPSAAGWTEMSSGWPARYAEYNSMTASGSVIDLSQRKTVFGEGHENNPILTKEEAEAVSYEVVMGGDDDWDPASAAEQAPEPTNVKLDNGVITWDNSDYASCWAVCKDGKVIGFTLEPTFEVSDEKAAYSVRAANEMGGLGSAVKAESTSAINTIDADSQIVSTVWYNLQGMRVSPDTKGVVLRVDTLESGRTVTTKTIVK